MNTTQNPINEVSKRVWDNIYCAIPNAFAVASMLGNLYYESGMNPMALDGGNAAGYSFEKYTDGVDSGKISLKKFAHDGLGYGLGHWTDWTRKQSLYNLAKKMGKSVGDVDAQVAFILDELNGVTYGPVREVMKKEKQLEYPTHFIAVKYIDHDRISVADFQQRLDYSKLFFATYGVDLLETSGTSVEKTSDVTKVVLKKNAYVRELPTSKSKEVCYALEGTTFDILGMDEKKKYYKVDSGWVLKSACKMI